MATRKTTLKDVARAAGVSTAAASFALRGRPGVSDETRDRVLTAAFALDYTANSSARSLRTARYGAIGLLLPPGATRVPYYTEFAFGVVDAAEHEELSVILLPHRRAADRPVDYVDGFIVVDADGEDPMVREMLADLRPVVSGESVETATGAPWGSVVADHDAALTELLSHLAAGGARRVAVLLPPATTTWGVQVAAAYRRWCADRSIEPRQAVISFAPTAEEVLAASTGILADPDVDALVVVPSGTAEAALDAARRLGRSVGRDLLLAAYVDEPVHSLVSPPVTSLNLQARRMGAGCLTMLTRAIAEPARAEIVVETIVPILERRESTTG